MNHFLIDFENVSSEELKQVKGIKKNDDVILFYLNACKNVSLESLSALSKHGVHFSAQKISAGTKNALDFQLASHLGYLIGTCPTEDTYRIVSKDKGYDCLITYWKARNTEVARIDIVQKPNEATTTKKSKVDPADKVTIQELSSVLSKKYNPEQILPIINKYKTKVAINNGITKVVKDTKLAGEIYQKLKPLLKKKNKK